MTSVLKRDIISAANDKNIPWEKLYGKSVLISGATGFIGSFMIYTMLEHALSKGEIIRIIAPVRSADKANKMFAEYIQSGMLTFIEQDICDKLKCDEHADYIIHCASNAAPREYSLFPVETMKTNFYGTLNLLDYAKSCEGSCFLYVSTIEVYGTTHGNEPIKEDHYGIIDSGKVRSCYPLSKKACENLTLSYADEYGVDVKIGRLSYIFGPGMRPGDTKVVAVFPKCIADNQDIVMKSKGGQLRSYTYVSDAIRGLLTVLLKGENGQAYNIASELCITTISNLAETLVSLYPEKGLKVKYDIPNEAELKRFSLINNAVLSDEKLKTLGWQSEISLAQGLRNTVDEQTELNNIQLGMK